MRGAADFGRPLEVDATDGHDGHGASGSDGAEALTPTTGSSRDSGKRFEDGPERDVVRPIGQRALCLFRRMTGRQADTQRGRHASNGGDGHVLLPDVNTLTTGQCGEIDPIVGKRGTPAERIWDGARAIAEVSRGADHGPELQCRRMRLDDGSGHVHYRQMKSRKRAYIDDCIKPAHWNLLLGEVPLYRLCGPLSNVCGTIVVLVESKTMTDNDDPAPSAPTAHPTVSAKSTLGEE